MIPERSEVAKSAKSVLFEEFNDIDIYIEDTAQGYAKLYAEIFSRLFKGEYKVSNVFPLGGRRAVIEDCEKWQGNFSRPSLYVVDGDMHIFVGDAEKCLDGLFVLPMYCIENILVDENAITEVLNEEEATKLRDQVRGEFNFSGWLAVNAPLLAELFAEYAVCFEFCPEVQTISFPVTSLVSSNKGELDRVKVDLRIKELRSEVVEKIGESRYIESRQKYYKQLIQCSDSILKYVSGKDYLLPLLLTRSRSIVKTKVPNLNFKIRLAMKCDIEKLLPCKECIAS